jgi:hypothetical protein
MGNATTQIIPIVGGRGIMSSARQFVQFFPCSFLSENFGKLRITSPMKFLMQTRLGRLSSKGAPP